MDFNSISPLEVYVQLGYEGTRDFRVHQNPHTPNSKVLKNSELFNVKQKYWLFSGIFLKNSYFLCIILINSVILLTLKRNLGGGSKFFFKFHFPEKSNFFFYKSPLFCCFGGQFLKHKYEIFESSKERSEFPRTQPELFFKTFEKKQF